MPTCPTFGGFPPLSCACRTMKRGSGCSAVGQLCAGREGSGQRWDEGGSSSLWSHPFLLGPVSQAPKQLLQATCVWLSAGAALYGQSYTPLYGSLHKCRKTKLEQGQVATGMIRKHVLIFILKVTSWKDLKWLMDIKSEMNKRSRQLLTFFSKVFLVWQQVFCS